MIDWTKPVETTEDPPRPVRVLATAHPGKYPVVVSVPEYGGGWAFADVGLDGTRPNLGVTLRNVAPPKPEPVLLERWVNLYPSRMSSGFETEDRATAVADTHDGGRVECRRIAWMSDGSPVEDDGLAWRKQIAVTQEAEIDRDHWKAKAEALQAEVDGWRKWEVEIANPRITKLGRMYDELQAEVERMKPVVDAAVAWCRWYRAAATVLGGTLAEEVRAYDAKMKEAG